MSVRDPSMLTTPLAAANEVLPPSEDERPAAEGAAAAQPEEEILAAAGRLIRGGFIMPSGDFALLALLKRRAAESGPMPDNSELLRAGLHALRQSGRCELRRLLDDLAPCAPRRRRGPRGPRVG